MEYNFGWIFSSLCLFTFSHGLFYRGNIIPIELKEVVPISSMEYVVIVILSNFVEDWFSYLTSRSDINETYRTDSRKTMNMIEYVFAIWNIFLYAKKQNQILWMWAVSVQQKVRIYKTGWIPLKALMCRQTGLALPSILLTRTYRKTFRTKYYIESVVLRQRTSFYILLVWPENIGVPCQIDISNRIGEVVLGKHRQVITFLGLRYDKLIIRVLTIKM